MDAIEFACFFQRLQKSIGIYIDSDIVGKIYDYYEGKYENYTLLELIYELHNSRVQIDCPWNKKELIKMIKERKLNIPVKHTPTKKTQWEHYNARQIFDTHRSDYIYVYDCNFEFGRRDVIKLGNTKTYSINIERVEGRFMDIIFVHLMNLYEHEEISMSAREFMHMIDSDDVTILQNMDKCHFMKD